MAWRSPSKSDAVESTRCFLHERRICELPRQQGPPLAIDHGACSCLGYNDDWTNSVPIKVRLVRL